MTDVSAVDPRALAQERLRLHAMATPPVVLAALLSGAALCALLWADFGPVLLGWWALLVVVVVVRLVLTGAHRRASERDQAEPPQWLPRYRLVVLLHGLVWLALTPLLMRASAGEGVLGAVFVITGMVGGALVTGSFDLRATLRFAVPAFCPVLMRLLGVSGPPEHTLLLVTLLFVLMMAVAGKRGAGMLARQVQSESHAQRRYEEAQRHAQDAEAARRELAATHERTEQLFRGTRQGYWFVDPQGRTLDLNPAMCELLGRPREAVLGRSVFNFFQGPEGEVLRQELDLRRAGKVGGYEVDIVRPDGTRVHAFNHATPIVDPQGVAQGSIGLWTDLTAQKNLEQELRTYERVTNSISDVVSVVDSQRRYRLVNDAWCTLTGQSRAQVLLTAFNPFHSGPGSTERLAALDDCLAHGHTASVTLPATLPDGREVVLQTQYHPYRDGSCTTERVILVTRDITEQARDREAVAVSAEYLRRTLNATSDAIFATDALEANQPVSFANDQMMRLWGFTQPVATLTPADILRAAAEQFAEPDFELPRIRAIIEANEPHESRVRLRDGRLLFRRYEPAQLAGRPLRVWSFRDITHEVRVMSLLQEREAQARALLDAFPGFISRFDADLRYTYVNAAQAQMAGLTPDAMLGRELHDVIGVRRALQLRELVPKVLAGQTVDMERSYRRPHGVMTMRVTLAAGRDPISGAPVLYAFGTDISNLKQAEQALRASEREMRALLRAFPGHILAVDGQSRYAYADERLSELFNRPLDQVLGHTVAEVLGEDRARVLRAEHDRARQGETVRIERTYHVGPQRERRDFEVTHVAGLRRLDGHQMIYTFSQDITARNRAREALAAARDEAERANKAKSQFLSHMSHELRTPMNAIFGFAQLLRRDQRAPLAPHQQGWAQQILRGAEHLLELINEMLDLGRIEAGRMLLELTPVSVPEVVNDSLAFVRELAHDHGVRLLPAEGLQGADGLPLKVMADRTRLRQVLLNLVANAIKYNRPDGHVQVCCWQQDGQVSIAVQDSGRGLDEQQRQGLFQPFERLGAERGGVEGTGIGLALSLRLVQAMGGDVQVSSQPGVGSTFTARLPACTPATLSVLSGSAQALSAASDTTAPATPSRAADRTVLYIDDNEVNVLLVETLLADAPGLRFISASRPAEGLQLALSERPSLVLLDIHMPDMDGYEVLARLRANPATADIPVVAVSADAMPTDVDAARAAGFSTYLTKPLDFEQLLQTVHRLSQERQNPAMGAP